MWPAGKIVENVQQFQTTALWNIDKLLYFVWVWDADFKPDRTVHCQQMHHKIYDLTNLFVSRYLPSSDGVKNMTHEAKAKAMNHKAKAMNHKAKAKAKDLTLRRHLYCNVNINKQQAYN